MTIAAELRPVDGRPSLEVLRVTTCRTTPTRHSPNAVALPAPRSGPLPGPSRCAADAVTYSAVLEQLPVVSADSIFVEPSQHREAKEWLKMDREATIQPSKEEDNAEAEASSSLNKID